MSYFAYSYDNGDSYEGCFGTEDDAFISAVGAMQENGYESFLLSLFQGTELKWNTKGEDIVDEIEENLSDELGYSVINQIASEKQIKDLDERLKDCISNWIKESGVNTKWDLISWTKRFKKDTLSGEYIEDIDYDGEL